MKASSTASGNVLTYGYSTSYSATEKINAKATLSCDGVGFGTNSITLKGTDNFSAILTGENASGNSFANAPIIFTVKLPKAGIDFIHTTLQAKIYDENNQLKSTVSNVPVVTYLSASNVESGTIQSTSVKAKISFSGLTLKAYEKMQVTLGFSGPQDYGTLSSIAFDFKLSVLTITSNDAQIVLGVKSDCEPVNCAECITSFSPMPGKEYLISAWVKETYTGSVPRAYKHSGILISFNDGAVIYPLCRPGGPVVDGWQRIDSAFTIPAGAVNIHITLVNEAVGGDVFFDDIRIHPYNSNMKSFVYDPSTQKLVAELDENNFATLYEYDDEGILIRVKKETERGVMTIKETRSNQSKVQNNAIKQ